MELDIRPISPVIGAEIHGIDLRQELDDATVAAVRRALIDRCVVFFRDQELTESEHLRFARRFAPVQRSVIGKPSTVEPDVMVLDTTAPKHTGTDDWHADHTCLSTPPLGTVLRAVQVPAVGGDTCFASMYDAYDRLEPAMQAFLDGLTAVHSTTALEVHLRERMGDAGSPKPFESAVHPVVRVHPESGRKLLFVSSTWVERIVELDSAASAALLAFLYDHVKQPEIQCRFHWQPGSVAFWDNRACQHYAVCDYRERRVMHRVMLEGDVPVGVG